MICTTTRPLPLRPVAIRRSVHGPRPGGDRQRATLCPGPRRASWPGRATACHVGRVTERVPTLLVIHLVRTSSVPVATLARFSIWRRWALHPAAGILDAATPATARPPLPNRRRPPPTCLQPGIGEPPAVFWPTRRWQARLMSATPAGGDMTGPAVAQEEGTDRSPLGGELPVGHRTRPPPIRLLSEHSC